MTLKWFSQLETLKKRKEKNLHPINEVYRALFFTAGYFCSICVSLTYAFDLFSTQFRNQFQLTVGDLSTISTVGLVFCYFLLPYSMIYERFGPFIPFLICGTVGFIGAVCLGLIFEGKISGNVAVISVVYAFLNTASGLFDVTYLSTLFEVFPRNRGPYICLAKVMTGLGSSIMACLSATLFDGNVTGFIYFIAVLCVVVALYGAFFMVLPPYITNYWRNRAQHTEEEKLELEVTRHYYEHKNVPFRRTFAGYCTVILLMIFVTIEAPVLAYTKVSRGGKVAVGVVMILITFSIFVMALPLKCLGGVDEPAPSEEELLAVRRYMQEAKRLPSSVSSLDEADLTVKPDCVPPVTGDVAVLEDELTDVAPFAEEPKCLEDEEMPQQYFLEERRQDPTWGGDRLRDYLLRPELWLVMAYLISVLPLAVLVSFNSTSISIAKTGERRSQELSTLYVAFLGVGNACGRILVGSFEAYVQHQPRERKFRLLFTHILPINALLLVLGGVLLIVLPGKIILLPFIVIYLENGMTQALMALIVSCLFQKFHNTLYSISFLCTVIVVICFNRLLFGLYNDQQHKKLHFSTEQECNVFQCVKVPLIICTCFAALGFVVAVVLHLRYSRYVRRVRRATAPKESEEVFEESNLTSQEA